MASRYMDYQNAYDVVSAIAQAIAGAGGGGSIEPIAPASGTSMTLSDFCALCAEKGYKQVFITNLLRPLGTSETADINCPATGSQAKGNGILRAHKIGSDTTAPDLDGAYVGLRLKGQSGGGNCGILLQNGLFRLSISSSYVSFIPVIKPKVYALGEPTSNYASTTPLNLIYAKDGDASLSSLPIYKPEVFDDNLPVYANTPAARLMDISDAIGGYNGSSINSYTGTPAMINNSTWFMYYRNGGNITSYAGIGGEDGPVCNELVTKALRMAVCQGRYMSQMKDTPGYVLSENYGFFSGQASGATGSGNIPLVVGGTSGNEISKLYTFVAGQYVAYGVL